MWRRHVVDHILLGNPRQIIAEAGELALETKRLAARFQKNLSIERELVEVCLPSGEVETIVAKTTDPRTGSAHSTTLPPPSSCAITSSELALTMMSLRTTCISSSPEETTLGRANSKNLKRFENTDKGKIQDD
jgi:hypothetical protein